MVRGFRLGARGRIPNFVGPTWPPNGLHRADTTPSSQRSESPLNSGRFSNGPCCRELQS